MNKRRKIKTALASSAAASLVLSAIAAVPVMAADNNFAGSDRIDTSIKIAEASWQGAWSGSTNAVIVQKDDDHLVDGLAVAPLAYSLHAPILLSDKGDSITKATMDELMKNGVKKVYLATGSGVITDKAKAQLEAAGITVERLGGANRYETAKNISAKLGVTSKVVVVNGEVGLADALSIASIAANQGMTIALASDKDTTPTTTDLTGKTVYAVGGSGVLSDTLVSKLGATRYGGSSRFETNAAILDGFKASVNFDKVYLTDGYDAHLVDALTGSVLAAQSGAPIVLTDAQVGANQGKALSDNLKGGSVVVTFGGTVSKAVQASIQKIADDKKAAVPTASLVGVDNSLLGTSIVEVKLNVVDPQNYDVTIKGQVANYYASSQSFKIASSSYLETIDTTKDVTITKKVSVTASLVGVDNSLLGTSIVEVKLNAIDPQNYNVTIKGQVANYYASSQSFKIASSTYLEAANVDVTKDVVVAHK